MTETPTPTTPREVTTFIGNTLRRKRSLLETLHSVSLDARAKRAAANRAESRSFLDADGAMEIRKHRSRIDPTTCRLQDEADVAEELVKHLRAMVAQCADEIDGARTAAATLRAEFSVLGQGPEEQ